MYRVSSHSITTNVLSLPYYLANIISVRPPADPPPCQPCTMYSRPSTPPATAPRQPGAPESGHPSCATDWGHVFFTVGGPLPTYIHRLGFLHPVAPRHVCRAAPYGCSELVLEPEHDELLEGVCTCRRLVSTPPQALLLYRVLRSLCRCY